MMITESVARFRMGEPVCRRTFREGQVCVEPGAVNPFPTGGPLWQRVEIVLANDGKTVGEITDLIAKAGWPKVKSTCRNCLKIGLIKIAN